MSLKKERFMKEYRLGSKKKKNSMTPFWIIVIVFTVIWLSIAFYGTTKENFDLWKTLFVVFVVGFPLTIGGILFTFFSRQITDIKFCDDEVLLIRESGDIVYRGSDDISISETPNRYLLHIADKQYSAYKYMPPKSFEHKAYIDGRIKLLKEEMEYRKSSG